MADPKNIFQIEAERNATLLKLRNLDKLFDNNKLYSNYTRGFKEAIGIHTNRSNPLSSQPKSAIDRIKDIALREGVSYMLDQRKKFLTTIYCMDIYMQKKNELNDILKNEKLSENAKLAATDNLKVYKKQILGMGIDDKYFTLAEATPYYRERIENEYHHTVKKYLKGDYLTKVNEVTQNIVFTQVKDENKLNSYLFDSVDKSKEKNINLSITYKDPTPQFDEPEEPYESSKELSLYDLKDGRFVKKDPPEGGFARFIFKLKEFFVGKSQQKTADAENKAMEESKIQHDIAVKQFEELKEKELKEEEEKYIKGRDKSIDDISLEVDPEDLELCKQAIKEDHLIYKGDMERSDEVYQEKMKKENEILDLDNIKLPEINDIDKPIKNDASPINQEEKTNELRNSLNADTNAKTQEAQVKPVEKQEPKPKQISFDSID